jgi:hypothetical protein
MRQSLVSPSQAQRPVKRSAPALLSLSGTPLTFLLTGFTWLSVSFLLGIALIIGSVYGTPLPRWLKPVHAHGALVGGILQLAIGVLLSITRASDRKDADAQSHTTLFLAWNGATAALLLGFWLGNMTVVGLAGLLLAATVLSLSKTAWIHFGKAAGEGSMYRIALVALFVGLAAGTAMAFRLTDGFYAHARLGHIHLIVLGCLTLSLIVALCQLMPVLLRTPLVLGSMTRFVLWFLPVGFAVLLGAFLMSAVWLQIAVGCLLFVSITLCTVHLVATWLKAGSPGTAAIDHLLIGAIFLLLATAIGLVMGANYLRSPPLLPIGSLHLVAYTHLAFIGFLTQVICGGLSYVVPDLLTATRVQNHAKREVYRAQLDGIMNRWRAVQLTGLSLGTIALSVLASLTWTVPLGSPYVQTSVWVAAGLLLASLALFAAKLAWVVGLRPS